MPKSKRGADKEKRSKKKSSNERDILSYEQQISDYNKQLTRLQTRNEELENEVESIKRKFQQLEEDRSDVVAHLRRNLAEKIEEARELNERLSALEETRKEELAAFKKKEETMELEYRTMESNLSAEVKLAAGKLSALEDWRLARLDLMKKFETQEVQLAEQEERHKQTLYEMEKKIIVDKAKMQREMEERLKELTQNFQSAMNIRTADATRRAIKENIKLNQILDLLFVECRNLAAKVKEHKDTEQMLKLQSDLYETEAKISSNVAWKQKRTIDKLAQEHANVNAAYGKILRENFRRSKYENILATYEASCSASKNTIQSLEQQLEEIEADRERVLSQVHIMCQRFNELSNVLNEAKECVVDALQLRDVFSKDDVCSLCCVDFKEKFFCSLLNILQKQSDLCISEQSKLQEESIQYKQYDLGLLSDLTCLENTNGEEKQ